MGISYTYTERSNLESWSRGEREEGGKGEGRAERKAGGRKGRGRKRKREGGRERTVRPEEA